MNVMSCYKIKIQIRMVCCRMCSLASNGCRAEDRQSRAEKSTWLLVQYGTMYSTIQTLFPLYFVRYLRNCGNICEHPFQENMIMKARINSLMMTSRRVSLQINSLLAMVEQ